ncbi:Verify 3D Structural Homology [Encephalitozoon hellem]|uniref:Verify 3D Structural Homology n=1 Tax=Encephalitozoon hellem TaxID=27973 RepID=A0A9Q9FAK0_ENCHE|nr:hypothetical protein GPU96_01g00110 [Encephalitozoon hellem]UTX43069.1 Verify 3D Structural Homology [Encephalitozoon hellem]
MWDVRSGGDVMKIGGVVCVDWSGVLLIEMYDVGVWREWCVRLMNV